LVEEDDVGLEGTNGGESLGRIGSGANQFDLGLGLQNATEAFDHDGLGLAKK